MKKRDVLGWCGLTFAGLLLFNTVSAQTFSDSVSELILGNSQQKFTVLEQPRSQPLPDYKTESMEEYMQRKGYKSKINTHNRTNPLTEYLNNLDEQGASVQPEAQPFPEQAPVSTQQSPLSNALRSEPIHLDEERLERFRNSPCWLSLGYSPDESYNVQEERYRNCEEAKASKENSHTLKVVLFVVLGLPAIGAIVYYGVKGLQTKTGADNTSSGTSGTHSV